MKKNMKILTKHKKKMRCYEKKKRSGPPAVGVEMKLKMYSFLVVHNEKAKGVNRNVVATISQNEYKDVLLNNKYIRH